MELVALILVLIVSILKPQEWWVEFNSLHPIQLLTLFIIIALYRKKGGVKLKDFFQTPHHWLIFIYFMWTVFTSPTPYETFQSIKSCILFYVLAVQALTTVPRMKKFMGWWALMLMIIAVLALLSEVGFDPFGSHELTEWKMKGRLSLNLSMFNNPNGLAHSVVPLIPMLYFLLFWKRIVMKILALVMILPLLCIYQTQSKGAFLCTFVTIATTLTFGRPKAVQVLILTIAATVGVSAIYTLPRMGELNKSKQDQAIQGRIEAARFGMAQMNRSWVGHGYGNFIQQFIKNGPMERIEHKEMHDGRVIRRVQYKHYLKASHGAYNENGADLGYPGLFIFVGILYCCLRSLIFAKTRDVEEERMRRILFSIVISYIVSCWMVDFFYRTSFFLFVAATAGFHVILSKPKESEVEVPETEPVPSWREQIQTAIAPVFGVGQPAVAGSSAAPVQLQQMISSQSSPAGTTGGVTITPAETEEPTGATMKWKRYGVFDFFVTWGLTYCVVEFWKYLIKTM